MIVKHSYSYFLWHKVISPFTMFQSNPTNFTCNINTSSVHWLAKFSLWVRDVILTSKEISSLKNSLNGRKKLCNWTFPPKGFKLKGNCYMIVKKVMSILVWIIRATRNERCISQCICHPWDYSTQSFYVICYKTSLTDPKVGLKKFIILIL